MNDFELLQFAAKAVGFGEIEWVDIEADWDIEEFHGARIINGGGLWNPLADSNDALNLSVMLLIDVNHGVNIVVAECPAKEIGCAEGYTQGEGAAATCRAIVRAAAEIGKAML